jgi:hypothetical protein
MALPKGSAAYIAGEAKVQTIFHGTTLRGLLLEAYNVSLMDDLSCDGSARDRCSRIPISNPRRHLS